VSVDAHHIADVAFDTGLETGEAAGDLEEGDQRFVPAFNLIGFGHHSKGVVAQLHRVERHVSVCMSHTRILGVDIEVFGIGIRNARLVSRLTGQPDEESLSRAQGAVDGRL